MYSEIEWITSKTFPSGGITSIWRTKMFAPIVILFISVSLNFVKSSEVLKPPTTTTAEQFPYHAIIETDGWWCNGVIISTEFIMTRGSCIREDKKAMIYVGFTRNPYVSRNQMDSLGQTYHTEKVFIHGEFGKILATNQYLNNLALVKTHKPIVMSTTVQPIAIASPDDYPIPPGTYINQTGFISHDDDGNLHYATVQMRDMDSCILYFGDSFLRNQERCVRQTGTLRNKWVGPYVVNGVLVGLQRSLHADAKCHVSSPPCDVHDVFLSLESYLEWIYKVSGVAGKNAERFQLENPYWQFRPERIQRETIKKIKDTVIDLKVYVETCKRNENEFIRSIQEAVERNVKKGLKSVTFTVNLV